MADGMNWSPGFVSQMQNTEGFTPTPKWDYKQYSWGYGTRWQPGMPTSVDQGQATNYLFDELGKARDAVTSRFGNLPQNVQEGLSSFTYNLGPGWMHGKNALTDAVDNGDWTGAAQHMAAYDRAGGVPNSGLDARRAWEGGLVQNPSYLGSTPGAVPTNGAPTQPAVPNANTAGPNGGINSQGPSVADVTGANQMPQQKYQIAGAPVTTGSIGAPGMSPDQLSALADDDLNAKRSQALADQLNKIGLGEAQLPKSNLEGASRVLAAVAGAYEGHEADANTKKQRLAMADLLGGQDPMVRLAAASGNNDVLNTVMSKKIENNMTLPQFTTVGTDKYGNPIHGFVDVHNQTVTPANESGGAAVQGADAGIDPKLQGSDYLAALEKVDPARAATLKAFNEGRGNYPMAAEARTPQGRQTTDDMNRAFPGFDQGVFTARSTMRKNYAGTGNSTGGGVLSLGGTAIQHLADLSDQNANIDKTNMGPQGVPFLSEALREGQNAWSAGTGDDRSIALKAATTARDNATGELTKFYTSTGGSRADRKDRLDNFDFSASPAEKQSAIKEAADQMQDKMNQLEYQWNQQFGGSVPFPGLAPEAKAAFDRIQKNYNVATGAAPAATSPPPNPVRGAGGATPPNPNTATQMPPVTVTQGGGAPAAAPPSQITTTPDGKKWQPDGKGNMVRVQ